VLQAAHSISCTSFVCICCIAATAPFRMNDGNELATINGWNYCSGSAWLRHLWSITQLAGQLVALLTRFGLCCCPVLTGPTTPHVRLNTQQAGSMLISSSSSSSRKFLDTSSPAGRTTVWAHTLAARLPCSRAHDQFSNCCGQSSCARFLVC
jgi:hypothetical protein